MKNKHFAYISPEFIDAKDAQNYHIFEGNYNPLTKRFMPADGKSCCGNYSHTRNAQYDEVAAEVSIEATLRKAREIAERLDTEGKKVCGRCIATLFRDNI